MITLDFCFVSFFYLFIIFLIYIPRLYLFVFCFLFFFAKFSFVCGIVFFSQAVGDYSRDGEVEIDSEMVPFTVLDAPFRGSLLDFYPQVGVQFWFRSFLFMGFDS